jgi:hypothetical protein
MTSPEGSGSVTMSGAASTWTWAPQAKISPEINKYPATIDIEQISDRLI